MLEMWQMYLYLTVTTPRYHECQPGYFNFPMDVFDVFHGKLVVPNFYWRWKKWKIKICKVSRMEAFFGSIYINIEMEKFRLRSCFHGQFQLKKQKFGTTLFEKFLSDTNLLIYPANRKRMNSILKWTVSQWFLLEGRQSLLVELAYEPHKSEFLLYRQYTKKQYFPY